MHSHRADSGRNRNRTRLAVARLALLRSGRMAHSRGLRHASQSGGPRTRSHAPVAGGLRTVSAESQTAPESRPSALRIAESQSEAVRRVLDPLRYLSLSRLLCGHPCAESGSDGLARCQVKSRPVPHFAVSGSQPRSWHGLEPRFQPRSQFHSQDRLRTPVRSFRFIMAG